MSLGTLRYVAPPVLPVDVEGEEWPDPLVEHGRAVGDAIIGLLIQHENDKPRSKQKALGMSSLGGCREFIRATIAGDPRQDSEKWKLEAMVGTAVGDYFEQALEAGDEGVTAQAFIMVEFKSGLRAGGSVDLLTKTSVIDLKTRDGLGDVRREGPPFKNKAQIFGYLQGAIQEGKLPADGVGHLVYIDRSGKDKTVYVWSLQAGTPEYEAIEQELMNRLHDVAMAITTGSSQGYLRDEPMQWCKLVECPFRDACWAGYEPETAITHPKIIESVKKYQIARADAKDAESRKAHARQELIGSEGLTPDGTQVRWATRANDKGTVTSMLTVRP